MLPQPAPLRPIARGGPIGQDSITALTEIEESDMAGIVEKKLAELGIKLPTPAAPIATYVGFVRTGSLLFVSGQLCLADPD